MDIKDRLKSVRRWGGYVLLLVVGAAMGAGGMYVEKDKERERGDMYYEQCQKLSEDVAEKNKTIDQLNETISELRSRLVYFSSYRQNQLDNIARQQQQIQSELQRQRTRDFFEGRFPY